MYIYTTL